MTTNQNSEPPVIAKEEGDLHDGDTGNYITTVDPTDHGLPATLQLLHDGYWYTYKIEGRKRDEEEVETELPPSDLTVDSVGQVLNTTDPLKDL